MKVTLKNKSLPINFWTIFLVMNNLMTIISALRCQCGKLQINPRVIRIHQAHMVFQKGLPNNQYDWPMASLYGKIYSNTLGISNHVLNVKCVRNLNGFQLLL